MAPAAKRHAAKSKIAVAVIAPADRFQHPDRPVQNAQNIVMKLQIVNNFIVISSFKRK